MVTGIITEYNPFHKGHLHQLNCIRAMTGTASPEPIVVCMSGSLTQRGELACLDKWQRAQAAVASGVNLVLELPAVFACSSAQYFARGGVQLLNSLGIVDQLAFGTAYPDIERLQQTAAKQLAIESPGTALHSQLTELLQQGYSYGSAISKLLAATADLPAEFLREPNTILALEYLRSLQQLHSSIQPIAIRRAGPQHKDMATIDSMASGQKIRSLLAKGAITEAAQLLPPAMGKVILQQAEQQISQQAGQQAKYLTKPSNPLAEPPKVLSSQQPRQLLPDTAKLHQLIAWQLMTRQGPELAEIYGFNEGLEYKFLAEANQPDYANLVAALATRRYPATRIQRTLCYLLLQLKSAQMADFQTAGPQYIRVLAFDDTGRQLLRQIKAKSQLPIITKVTDYLNRRDLQQGTRQSLLQQMLWYDIASTNLRQLCCSSHQPFTDLTTKPIYIK